MIFYARATRGHGLPSLDARSGGSISPHPLKGERASLEGTCISFDARSERQSGHSLLKTKKHFQKMCRPRWPLVLSRRGFQCYPLFEVG